MQNCKGKMKTKELEGLDKILLGYARVSTIEQDLGFEAQLDKLEQAGCHLIFSEKDSGGKDDRIELRKMLKTAKRLSSKGKDVSVVVYKIDRLTRKMSTLSNIINELCDHGITFVSLQENIVANSLLGRFICQAIGFVAEMELDNIRTRTKDGLRKARERGSKLGNPGLPKEKEKEILRLYQLLDLSISDIAQRVGVSDKTVYNVAKRHNLSRKYRKVVAKPLSIS
ncbi:recombinase family protein [Enterococcus raffinosus]|jgi:DNA invertase Pin-like site-specific DNA recombinase|uniref:recombinase family protein n=1 Tax=Enterococcus raffinosus TaxID=71452 RepID=UPI00209DA092|nr:recombinase family protein [Enterococcus raffinosus]